jgi:hypothetical protein
MKDAPAEDDGALSYFALTESQRTHTASTSLSPLKREDSTVRVDWFLWETLPFPLSLSILKNKQSRWNLYLYMYYIYIVYRERTWFAGRTSEVEKKKMNVQLSLDAIQQQSPI